MDKFTFGNYRASLLLIDEINKLPNKTRKAACRQISNSWNKYSIGINEIRKNINHPKTRIHMIDLWRAEFVDIVKNSSSIPNHLKHLLLNMIVAKARVTLKECK